MASSPEKDPNQRPLLSPKTGSSGALGAQGPHGESKRNKHIYSSAIEIMNNAGPTAKDKSKSLVPIKNASGHSGGTVQRSVQLPSTKKEVLN